MSFSREGFPVASSVVSDVERLHPPITDDQDDVYTPSGLRQRSRLERETFNAEKTEVLERLREEAARLLAPLQDVHDARLELSYLLFHNSGIVSPEEVRQVKEAIQELRRDAGLLDLIHVYPSKKETVFHKNELIPLYEEMKQVSEALLQNFPYLFARVRQMYENFLPFLSEDERMFFTDQHDRTTWNFCSPGGYVAAESYIAQREQERERERPEHERSIRLLEEWLVRLEEEMKKMKEAGIDGPEEAALFAVKAMRFEKLMQRKNKQLNDWEGEISSLRLQRLSILSPLNWVLQDICDPELIPRLKRDVARLKERGEGGNYQKAA